MTMTPCEAAFVDSVKTGLDLYGEKSSTSFFRSQSEGSKKAVEAISKILKEIKEDTKTALDLRNTLKQHEPTMQEALKLTLGSVGATSSRYDSDVGFEKMVLRRK